MASWVKYSVMAATPQNIFGAEATNREEHFPEVPRNLWSKVQNASFTAGFNQENLFRHMYYESAKLIASENLDTTEQGGAIFDLFSRWRDVARQFTAYVLSDDPDNPLDANLNYDPEGAGEAYVRPLRPVTFQGNASPAASYTQTYTTLGRRNWIPDENSGAGNDTGETAPTNEKAWMIFGYIERLAGSEVPYDVVQANINDNVGTRREENLLWQMEGSGTLKVAERTRGPLLVEPGFTLDLDLNIKTTNIQTGLWPVGIEVIRADSSEFGGPFEGVTN